MRTVLCYGDSNTWGYNPVENGERHSYEDRWTTVLQKTLGDDFNIIPEGLNGRTTVWDNPLKECVNGKTQLLPTLLSHKPIDLVVLFLGTNDLKKRLNLHASDIALGVGSLVDIIKTSGVGVQGNSPDILVVIPPEVRELSNFKDQFDDCLETSKNLPKYYKQMAATKGVDYIEIGTHTRFSNLDGIHFEKSQLPILGSLIADYVKRLY